MMMTATAAHSSLDLKEWHPSTVTPEAAKRQRSRAFWKLTDALSPVATPGTLVGNVVDRCGLPVLARVLVYDGNHALVGESYTCGSRAGCATGWFEVRGLAAGIYTVAILATGFVLELRYDVRIEPSDVTNLGRVRLIGANAPCITVALCPESVPPPLPAAA